MLLRNPIEALGDEGGRLAGHDVAQPANECIDRVRACEQPEETDCDQQSRRDRQKRVVRERGRDARDVVTGRRPDRTAYERGVIRQ
jgi:hypothetical protein